MREAIEWVNATADSGDVVVIGGNWNGARVFVDWSLTPISLETYQQDSKDSARYYVGLNRWDFMHQFPESPIVFSVVRDGISLAIVREIDSASLHDDL